MAAISHKVLELQFDRRLGLEFQGAGITSDAGLLACRELDGAPRLMEIPPLCLRETRSGRNVQHELVSLLCQPVYSRLAEYEETVHPGWPGTLLCRRPAQHSESLLD